MRREETRQTNEDRRGLWDRLSSSEIGSRYELGLDQVAWERTRGQDEFSPGIPLLGLVANQTLEYADTSEISRDNYRKQVSERVQHIKKGKYRTSSTDLESACATLFTCFHIP